jgi:hypothetical protein
VVEGVEVVTLDYPIKRGDTEVKEITLRKPLAGQLRGIKLGELLNLDVGSVQMILPRISTPTLLPHESRSSTLPTSPSWASRWRVFSCARVSARHTRLRRGRHGRLGHGLSLAAGGHGRHDAGRPHGMA